MLKIVRSGIAGVVAFAMLLSPSLALADAVEEGIQDGSSSSQVETNKGGTGDDSTQTGEDQPGTVPPSQGSETGDEGTTAPVNPPETSEGGSEGNEGEDKPQDVPELALSTVMKNMSLVDAQTAFKGENVVWTSGDSVKLYFTDDKSVGIDLQTLKLASISQSGDTTSQEVIQPVSESVDGSQHPVYTLLVGGSYAVYNEGYDLTGHLDTFTVQRDGAVPTLTDGEADSIVDGTQTVDVSYVIPSGRFTSKDDESGPRGIQVTVDDAPYDLGGSDTLAAGTHKVSVVAVDNVGNQSDALEFALMVVDSKEAFSSITVSANKGAVVVASPDGALTQGDRVFLGEGAQALFQTSHGYSLEGAGLETAGIPLFGTKYTLDESAVSGRETIKILKDSVDTGLTFDVVVDKTAPVITITDGGLPETVLGESFTLKGDKWYSADDGVDGSGIDGVGVSVDNEPKTPEELTAGIELSAGAHQITLVAADRVGESSSVTRSVVVIDPTELSGAILDSADNDYVLKDGQAVWYGNKTSFPLSLKTGYSLYRKTDGGYTLVDNGMLTPGEGEYAVGNSSVEHQTDETVAPVVLRQDTDAPTRDGDLGIKDVLQDGAQINGGVVKSGASLKSAASLGFKDAGVGIDTENSMFIVKSGEHTVKVPWDDTYALDNGDYWVSVVVADELGNTYRSDEIEFSVITGDEVSVEGVLENADDYVANGMSLFRRADGSWPKITYTVEAEAGIESVETLTDAVADVEFDGNNTVVVTFKADGSAMFRVHTGFGNAVDVQVGGKNVPGTGDWSSVATSGSFTEDNVTVKASGAVSNGGKLWYASLKDMADDVELGLVDSPATQAPINVNATASSLYVNGVRVPGKVSDAASKTLKIDSGKLDGVKIEPDTEGGYSVSLDIVDVLGQSNNVTPEDAAYWVDSEAPIAASESQDPRVVFDSPEKVVAGIDGSGRYYVTGTDSGVKSSDELTGLVNDDQSGVEGVYVTVNGHNVGALSSGENEVVVKAVDRVGNSMDLFTMTVVVGDDTVEVNGITTELGAAWLDNVVVKDGALYYKVEKGRPRLLVTVPVPFTGIGTVRITSGNAEIANDDYHATGKITLNTTGDGQITMVVVNGLGLPTKKVTLKGSYKGAEWSEIRTVDVSKFSVSENPGSGDIPFRGSNGALYYASLTGPEGSTGGRESSLVGNLSMGIQAGAGNLDIERVEATVNGVNAGVAYTKSGNTDGRGTATLTGEKSDGSGVLDEPENNVAVPITVTLFDELGNSRSFALTNDYRVDSVAPAMVDGLQGIDLLRKVLGDAQHVVVGADGVAYVRTDENKVSGDIAGLADDAESGIRGVDVVDGDGSSLQTLPEGETTVRVVAQDNVGNSISVDLGKVVVTDDKISGRDVSAVPVNGRKYYSKGGNLYYRIADGLPSFSVTVDNPPATGISEVRGGDNTSVGDIKGNTFTVSARGDGEVSFVVVNGLGVETEVSLSGRNTQVDGDDSWAEVVKPNGVGKVSASPMGKVYKTGSQAAKDVVFSYGLDADSNPPVDEDSTGIEINGRVVESKSVGSGERKIVGNLSDDDHVFSGSVVVVDVLGNTWTKPIEGVLFYVDNVAPGITGISVTGGSVRKPDKGGGRYTQIFNTAGTYTIVASDGGDSWQSGVAGIHYRMVNSDGSTVEEKTVAVPEGSNSISVTTPDHFRGWLADVRAIDAVGNEGTDGVDSEGIIAEGVVLDGDQGIGIDITQTDRRDADGNPLYNGDVEIGVSSRMSWSGFDSAQVSVNGNVLGGWNSNMFSQLVDSVFGVILGDVRGSVTYGNEGNGQSISASATDKAGHTITADTLNGRKAIFSIDKTAPGISVTWNETNGDGLYGSARVATVTISDVNPDASHSSVEAKDGVFGGWSTGADGKSLVGTVTFGTDTQNARLVVNSTDLAGNSAQTYQSEEFTVDLTAPTLTVVGNGEARNGNYYNINRVFTITVNDANFAPNGLQVEGGSLDGMSQSGNVWTGSVTTSGDGEHTISVTATDKVGHSSERYQSETYIQDTKAPAVRIEGLTNGASYSGDDIQYTSGVSDENLDGSASYTALVDNTGKETVMGGNRGLAGGVTSADYGTVAVPGGKDKDGYYTIRVHAEDKAGNVTDNSLQFTVNRYGGQYTFATADYSGKYLHEVGDISLSETSYDRLDTGRATVIITRNGLQLDVPKDAFHVIESGGSDGKPWKYEYVISKDLFKEDGVYRIQVYSFTLDGRGSTSASIDYTFVIDNTAPTVAITGIEADSDYYSRSDIPVSVIVRDEYGLSEGSYETSQNRSGAVNNGYSVTYVTAGAGITVSAKAADLAGNRSDVLVSGVNVYSSFWQRYAWVFVVVAVVVLALLVGLMVGRRMRNTDGRLLRFVK